MTMTMTLSRACDRAGHALRILVVLAALAAPATAQSGAYKAQRFDVNISPQGGDIVVTEAITFEFQSGTFKRVWREIPTSRTDGIEIVEARMDDVVFTPGDGEGHIEVSGRNRLRVQWNFAPVAGPSAHIFDLKYIVRGVIYRENDSDVLRWRALPTEHRYTIDASHISVTTAGGFLGTPERHRVGNLTISTLPPGLMIDASNIRSNGWILADVRYPKGAMISSLPKWQERREYANTLGSRWLAAAGAVLALGLLIVFGARQGYSEPASIGDETTTTTPPDALPAAMAAALAAKGRASGYQGIATIVDLADRGVLTIHELPRTLGVRQYEVRQVGVQHTLEPHEKVAIDIAFGDRADHVNLSRVRGRMARGGRRFVNAVNADLERRGLLDPARKAARDRLTVTAVVLLIMAPLGSVALAPLIPTYQAWPFLLPLGLLIAGVVGIITAASMSPLSDRGAMEGARWRGFRRYLKTLAGDREERGAIAIDTRWIVYAIAVGLAAPWARLLKARPGVAPDWFVAVPGDNGGFAAFVGSQAAVSAGHSGGVAGGGAAGGGSSGAG
jgi:hypothetical protein